MFGGGAFPAEGAAGAVAAGAGVWLQVEEAHG